MFGNATNHAIDDSMQREERQLRITHIDIELHRLSIEEHRIDMRIIRRKGKLERAMMTDPSDIVMHAQLERNIAAAEYDKARLRVPRAKLVAEAVTIEHEMHASSEPRAGMPFTVFGVPVDAFVDPISFIEDLAGIRPDGSMAAEGSLGDILGASIRDLVGSGRSRAGGSPFGG